MAPWVTPTPNDADNFYGSFTLAARSDWRFGDADSMSARASTSPHQMPDIRLQAQPSPPDLSISFLSWVGSPYIKLDPCLPDGGVSATVKDGKDNDPPRFRNEVDAEGEAIGCDPSNVLSNHCIELWMLCSQSNAAINFGGELNAEAYPLCLVTRCCLIKL